MAANKMIHKSLKSLFSSPSKILFFIFWTNFFFFFTTALGNLVFLKEFFEYSSAFGILLKTKLLLSLLLNSFASPFTFVLTIIISLLVSTNILLVAQSQKWPPHVIGQPMGLAGILSGVLGMGCAACGTFLSSTLLSFFGITFVSATLPFQNIFFQFIGIFLLVISISLFIRKSSQNEKCALKK